jgi:hypothetical protein
MCENYALDRTYPPHFQGPMRTVLFDVYRKENVLTFEPHKDIYVFHTFGMGVGVAIVHAKY